MHNIYILFIIIAQQAGQSPKVKSPPPVPLKPPRAPKPQTVSKTHIPSPSQSVERSSSATTPSRSQTLSESTHKPPPPPKAPKPQKVLPKQPEQQQQSSLQPSEQSQGSSSLEYITLREMLADLVDLLAGNAPVITQLNNHLFSPGLIPKAVHIAVESVGLTPYDRANKMIDAVLAILECHPNPNSAFTSLITALRKVGLTTIATKLSDALSKRI